MQKKATTAKPTSSTDIISRITSKLKRHRNKEGLYIICINATKLISPSELEQIKESAKTLTKFLLKDPNNWVGVFSLNDEFKYLDRSRFSQKFQQVEGQIKGIQQQQSNQPITILNCFAKGWKKDDKILKTFDTFVVVMSHIVFNPDQNLFKVFSNKKLHLVPCLFGENPVICKDKTLKFATSHDLHTNFKSLITKAENFDCRVELTLEHYAVVVKFLANIEDPELEIRIIKKEEGQYLPIDAIFTNQKQLRIEKLEPGCQYIMKYRFYFSDGMSSAFFEEVHFQTLSQSIRDIELLKSDQAKAELAKVRENILSLSVTSIEKLMGIHSYNILLFGRIGAGKSSFASTLNRAGTGVFNPNFAYVDFSYKSCTKELNKLELYNCSPIRLWDTFGIDDKNYDHSLLEYILDGRVKDQYRPGDSIYGKESKLGDSVHAVIIVIDVQMFPEQEELEKLRQKVNSIKDKKHYPILIITKLDTLNPKIGPSVSCKNMYNIKQSEEIIKRAHELFRIDKNNIFFMINYHGEEPQDVFKELIALRILTKSVERARQFIMQRKKILIKDINGKGKKIIPLAHDDLSLAEFRDSYGIQIAKMLKSEDFYFVEYPDDEDDTNLYEIDQIDEEHGEKIKFLNVAKRSRVTKTQHHHHRFEKSMSESLNSRVEDEEFGGTMMDRGFGDVELTYSQEISKHSKQQHKNKSKTPTAYRDSQAEQTREFNLEDSKSEYESVELSNGHPEKLYFQERYDDLVIEDLHSPYRSRRVIMVMNGEDEKELDEIDMYASLHKIRKRIAEQFPTFNEKNFAFTKNVEDKEIPIPALYENESAIILEQVMKPIGDSTAKFYIRTQM